MSPLRRDLLLRTAMEVLRQQSDPTPVGEVIASVADRLDLNEHELSRNNSGGQRFDTFIRFASGWMAGAAWLAKSREGWQLTPEGVDAMDRYDAAEFLREVQRIYRANLERRRTGATEIDPRWRLLRDAVAAIPDGSWTAYKDLADLIGMPAQTVGTYLASKDVPNAYRVLTINGTVSEDFQWNDENHTGDPKALLEEEGVQFDDAGRAAAAQRITTDELRDFVGSVASGSRAWLVRGSAVSGVNVVDQWLTEGFVSLAASQLRRLDAGVPLEELRAAVEADYAHLSYNQRQAKLVELHAFLNRTSVGDAVVTTSEGRVHVGRVAGEAHFTDAQDPLMTIRRAVDWQLDGVDFADLDAALQSRLKAAATVVDLTDVVEDIEALLVDEAGPLAPPAMPREVALRNLSAAKLDELLVGSDWLEEFVDLLRTRRQVILHGPPGTGKTFLALEVAQSLTDPANVSLVQFHPAYSYEDFFEGYRPVPAEGGSGVQFTLTPGPFRKLVDRARESPGTPFILVIDEINRANLAKVFGELYFLLEYRDRSVELMYGSVDAGRDFTLPRNVYVIGTMNTADRSIALVDAAMRRRFAFLSLHPDDAHLRNVLRDWLTRKGWPTIGADLLNAMNRLVPDRDFKVGPSYLMRPEAATPAGLERIWRTAILPLLEELHYGDLGIDVTRRYGLPTLYTSLGMSPSTTDTDIATATGQGDGEETSPG